MLPCPDPKDKVLVTSISCIGRQQGSGPPFQHTMTTFVSRHQIYFYHIALLPNFGLFVRNILTKDMVWTDMQLHLIFFPTRTGSLKVFNIPSFVVFSLIKIFILLKATKIKWFTCD